MTGEVTTWRCRRCSRVVTGEKGSALEAALGVICVCGRKMKKDCTPCVKRANRSGRRPTESPETGLGATESHRGAESEEPATKGGQNGSEAYSGGSD